MGTTDRNGTRRGGIDYKPILFAAEKAGVHDFYVEQEPPFVETPALAAVTVDYDYLRALEGRP